MENNELSAVQNAMVLADEKQNKELVNNTQVKQIIEVLQDFLRRKQLICYGGTAVNNILPADMQFYDLDTEIPDYDFYSKTPMDDAKELADIYHAAGHPVQAKAGIHEGTFKVFVDYIPIADITNLPEPIYDAIKPDVIVRDGISYAPANFLKMNMYLELSRPDGDTTRWEKIYKRLQLLNKAYPPNETESECSTDGTSNDVKSALIEYIASLDEVVFLAGVNLKNVDVDYGTIDLLSERPREVAEKIKSFLSSQNKVATIESQAALGEIIPESFTISIGSAKVVHIYQPVACHNYNETTYNGHQIRVATTDTMLNFYLAFLYVGNNGGHKRVLCTVNSLFDLEKRQKGKRFSMNCIGKQQTLLDIRKKKSEMFIKLENQQGTREYDWWFLNYDPAQVTRRKKRVKEPKVAIKSQSSVAPKARHVSSIFGIDIPVVPAVKVEPTIGPVVNETPSYVNNNKPFKERRRKTIKRPATNPIKQFLRSLKSKKSKKLPTFSFF
jgi:hypothetical protein